MFFAAVEELKNPELKDKPFVVGTTIVSTSNYIARKFGIRSAMPVFIAKKLCPDLITTEVHSDEYREYSKKFMSILG